GPRAFWCRTSRGGAGPGRGLDRALDDLALQCARQASSPPSTSSVFATRDGPHSSLSGDESAVHDLDDRLWPRHVLELVRRSPTKAVGAGHPCSESRLPEMAQLTTPLAEREAHDLGGVVELELSHGVLAMRLDRVDAHRELDRDVLSSASSSFETAGAEERPTEHDRLDRLQKVLGCGVF